MSEDPIYEERIKYMNLYLDLYKFRDRYLSIASKSLDDREVRATIETKFSIAQMENVQEINECLQLRGGYDSDEDIVETIEDLREQTKNIDEFVLQREYETGSEIQMKTYREYLTPILSDTTTQNNIILTMRMLEMPKLANKYVFEVTRGKLKGCTFDGKKPFLFLGDTVEEAIPNIYTKIYLKTVSIESDVSRMQPKQRHSTRMAISTALKKKQKGRDTTLNNDLMKNIMEYGGKKKSNTKTRKYLIKKSKTKTRKYLIKKSKTKTRKTRKRS